MVLIEQFCDRKPLRTKEDRFMVFDTGDFARCINAGTILPGEQVPPRRYDYVEDQVYQVLRVDTTPLVRGRRYYLAKCCNNEGDAMAWLSADHLVLTDRPEGWVGALPLMDRPPLTHVATGDTVIYRGHNPEGEHEMEDWGRRSGLRRGRAYTVRLVMQEGGVARHVKLEGVQGSLWVEAHRFSPQGEILTLATAARSRFQTRRRSRRTFWKDGNQWLYMGTELGLGHIVRMLHPTRGWQSPTMMNGNYHIEVLQPEDSQVQMPT